MLTTAAVHRSFAVLLLALASLLLSGCEEKMTEENFARIQMGMSLSQVEGIFGSGTKRPTETRSLSGAYGIPVTTNQASDNFSVYDWEEGWKKLSVTFRDGKVIDWNKNW